MKTMKNKILWIVTLLPVFVTAVAIQFMKDQVPMHYGIGGKIDRWGSKYENFTFPVMIVLFSIFWILMIRYFHRKSEKEELEDKARQEAKSNEKVLYYAAIGTTVLFNLMQYAILGIAFCASKSDAHTQIDFQTLTNILMGIFFIVLGNVIPKAKRNNVIGVRTSWSMENDKTWEVSNRLGGISLMITGALTTLESLIVGGFASTMIMLGLVIVDAIIMVAITYKAYIKYK